MDVLNCYKHNFATLSTKLSDLMTESFSTVGPDSATHNKTLHIATNSNKPALVTFSPGQLTGKSAQVDVNTALRDNSMSAVELSDNTKLASNVAQVNINNLGYLSNYVAGDATHRLQGVSVCTNENFVLPASTQLPNSHSVHSNSSYILPNAHNDGATSAHAVPDSSHIVNSPQSLPNSSPMLPNVSLPAHVSHSPSSSSPSYYGTHPLENTSPLSSPIPTPSPTRPPTASPTSDAVFARPYPSPSKRSLPSSSFTPPSKKPCRRRTNTPKKVRTLCYNMLDLCSRERSLIEMTR